MEFLTLDGVPLAVTTARHWVVAACRRRGVDEATCDALELLAAEMVGNAVKHGEGRIDLSLDGPTARATTSVLVLSVTDAGADRPRPRRAGEEDTTGRGLALVAALTVDWGVTAAATHAGKTTWALVATGSVGWGA